MGFRQSVYENWKNDEGGCAGCPIRDQNLHADARPQFGGGSLEADIVFVNNTPRFTSGTEYDGDQAKRMALDTPKSFFKDDQKPRNPPENVDDPIEAQEIPDGVSLYSAKLKTWSSFEDIRRYLFSDEPGPGFLDISILDTYYTNALKCPALVGDSDIKRSTQVIERDDRNNDAQTQCSTYLEQELFDELSPSVVVGCGDGITPVASLLGIEDQLSGTIKNDFAGNGEEETSDDHVEWAGYGRDPMFIPAYQLSGGLQSAYWARKKFKPNVPKDSVNDHEFYFYKLAQRLIYEVDSIHAGDREQPTFN